MNDALHLMQILAVCLSVFALVVVALMHANGSFRFLDDFDDTHD